MLLEQEDNSELHIMEFSKKNIKYMEMAKNATQYSDMKRLKFGAVLTKNGKVLNVGWNSTKSHPMQKKLNCHRSFGGDSTFGKEPCRIHAEVSCLLPFNKDDDLSRAELYVYRLSGGKANIARPCLACQERIKELGIRKIYYTTSEHGYAFEEI